MSTPIFSSSQPEKGRTSATVSVALLALVALGALLFGFAALLAWVLTWAGFPFWPSVAVVIVAFIVTVVGSAIGSRGTR